jgi:hypothetical protein
MVMMVMVVPWAVMALTRLYRAIAVVHVAVVLWASLVVVMVMVMVVVEHDDAAWRDERES